MRRVDLRILPLALALAVAGAATACGDAPADDTSNVTAELLGSRQTSSGSPPLTPPERAPASTLPPGRAPAGGSSGGTTVDLAEIGHDLGDEAAPVRVLEFSDFACGYCRQFHTETWPTLAEEYVDAGKVYWKFVPMELGIFGPNSEEAALAAECAARQDLFRPVADRLFDEQRAWKGAGEPLEVIEELVEDAGADVDRWRACVADGELAARVRQGTALSRQLGVRGTPTFFVLDFGAIPGAVPLDIFREVLDSAVVRASAEDAGADR